MIKTAEVVSVNTDADTLGLFDTVTVYVEEDDAEETYRLVTTARADVLENRISGESPMGKALLGHKVGDRILIEVNPTYSYYVVIRSIEKGTDDASLSIN